MARLLLLRTLALKRSFLSFAHTHFGVVCIQAEDLSQWRLKRVISDENDRAIEFAFPTHFHLAPGRQIRVYAQGQCPQDARDFELHAEKSWGEGEKFTRGASTTVQE